MFHKTVYKTWNFFNLSKQSPEKFCGKFSFRVSINWQVLLIDCHKPSRNSRIFFFTISIDRAKVLTDRKCCILNFHLENFRTWIFTLWNNILQIQASLLQPIHVYTYIYNIFYIFKHYFIYFIILFYNSPNISVSTFIYNSLK